MKDDHYTKPNTSDFNSSIATLIRIDEIKKHLDASTSNPNVKKYWDYIKMLYKELQPIMIDGYKNRDLIEKYAEKFEKFRHRIDLNPDKLDINGDKYLKIELENFEIELRVVDQQLSLNMKMATRIDETPEAWE